MPVLELPTPDPRALDAESRPFAEAIADRYAVKRLLGRGGMGMVYLARDKRLDRLVAIKTLPAHLSADETVRERFLRETRTAGAMAHPNIVAIHGADEVDGHVFFVMSHVSGASLAALVQAQGRLAPEAVVRYLRDVADALAHAHARGIIHRDIKAENILIDERTDRALVTDFGIARLAEASPLTVTGQVLGTVHYVSPEQVSGGLVDARSDLYSLGVVGFLALTGRFPFEAELASAVMLQHVTTAPAPVNSLRRDVPRSIASIIDRCLAKSPDHRFASAADLIEALDSANSTREPRPPLISDAEAQELWQRAAELQALTGIQPRPPIVPRERDAASDLARTSGFDLGAVRSAAEDAGISARYVDHALGEHGLSPASSAVAPAALTAAIGRTRWPGIPLRVEVAHSFSGELPATELAQIILTLRGESSSRGETLAETRELVWRTGRLGASTLVSVTPLDNRTELRVVRDLRRSVLLRTLGALAVTAGVVLPSVIGIAIEIDRSGDLAAIAALVIGPLFLWKAGGWWIRRGVRKATAKTRALAERVGAQITRLTAAGK